LCETDTGRSDGDKDEKLEAASKQRQIRRQSGRQKSPDAGLRAVPRATDEVDYFRMADHPETIEAHSAVTREFS
jgi:hypothetical protein